MKFIFIFLLPTLAQAGSFTARVDKTVGTIADQFVLTLTIDGKADEKPKLPAIAGLETTSAATSHSTSWVNGMITREIRYRYILTPEREGVYKIPSLSLHVDGEMYRTLPITLKVQKDLPLQDKEEREIFIERDFSSREVYVGEQVIETMKVFYRVKLVKATQADVPLVDFVTFPLGEEKTYQQMVKGRNYRVTEVKKVIIPLQAREKLEVPRFILRTVIALTSPRAQRSRPGFFDDFFSFGSRQVQRRIVSDTFVLKVKPLPPSSPPGNLEVVGNFEISATVNKRQIKMGESVTLTVKIAGYGNLQGIKPLAIKLKDVKIYADKPEVKVMQDLQKGLYSEAVLKLALLPVTAGRIELGKMNLSYFKPAEHRFVTNALALGEIEVAPGVEEQVTHSTTRPAAKSAVQVLGADLITIHRGEQLLAEHGFPPALRYKLLLWAVFFIIAYGSLWVYVRFFRNRPVPRRSRAYRVFKKAQLALGEEGISRVDKNFRTYLGAKLNLQGLAATTGEIHAELMTKKVEKPLQERICKHLQEMEKILFSRQETGNHGISQFMTETNNLVKEVEKKC